MRSASAVGQCLRLEVDERPLERVRADRADGHCRWLHGDADPPYEQGAGLLRCVPFGAMVRVDGGRPTSRGLSPAAFWGTGDGKTGLFPKKGFSRVWTLERVRAEPAVLPAGWQGERAAREERFALDTRKPQRHSREHAAKGAAPPRFPLPGAPAKQLLKDRPLRKRPFSATHQNQARQL